MGVDPTGWIRVTDEETEETEETGGNCQVLQSTLYLLHWQLFWKSPYMIYYMYNLLVS